MNDRSYEPHRRAEDRTQPEKAAEHETTGNKLKRLAYKFRHPLIGLGLAGAAAPMAQNVETPRVEGQEEVPGTAPAAGGDLEESLAEELGGRRAESDRDRRVESAVTTYGISRPLAQAIYDNAVEAGIDPKMAYGLVKTESSFKPRAVSHVGARGLTQVMPRTARWLVPGTRADDLFDQKTNLRLGFRYLNQLVDKYNGDTKLALLAYNRGPGTVDRVLERGGDPDNGYADKVLGGADEMGA